MALKRPAKEDKKEAGPNDSIGEQPVDAPVGFAPRIVKVPMHQNADVNPKVHEAKLEEKKQREKSKPKVMLKKGAGWDEKDERMYQHIKDSGASEKIAAATVNKQRRKEGRLLHKGASEMKPNVTLLKSGVGSRGGKVSYYTKSGKPVYQSRVKKMAPQFSQMASNWTNNANRSNDPEHHAIAAKQHLAAAFYQHHAGDSSMVNHHMVSANAHRDMYEDKGHKSRTTKWIDKHHDSTAEMTKEHTGHSSRKSWLDGDISKKSLRKSDDSKDPKNPHHYANMDVRAQGPGGPGSRGGNIIGHTKSGKPVYGVKRVHARLEQKASEAVAQHGLFSEKAHPAVSHSQRALDAHFHESTPGYEMHWSPEDHMEAGNMLQDHKREKLTDRYEQYATQGLANRHFDAAEKKKEAAQYAAIDRHEGHPPGTTAKRAASMRKSELVDGMHSLMKAFSPGNNLGGNMSKNEVSDLFKSELGESNAKPITTCVHCNHSLSRSDLVKGLGPHAVADDNDNPHSGGDGQVEPSRGAPGVSEHDEIAPLLKGLKGKEAGDSEEYPIHKSEMLTMGMNADELQDGWYTITKSEMMKQAPQHLPFLADRKERVAKAMKPAVNPANRGGEPIRKSDGSRSTTDGPHGYSPRAGGVHGPSGESLVQWVDGSDKQVAEYIEKSGGYGPGTDELVRTQGRGF